MKRTIVRRPIRLLPAASAVLLVAACSASASDSGQGNPLELLRKPSSKLLLWSTQIDNVLDTRVAALEAEAGMIACETVGGLRMEAPYADVRLGSSVRLGIRAGDILLAVEPPRGTSARNVDGSHSQGRRRLGTRAGQGGFAVDQDQLMLLA